MNRRTFLATSGSTLALAGLGARYSEAFAQGHFPDRALTYIVAYTPGSANDILVRLIAPEFGRNLGQPVIVENKAGAGGSLGMSAVARARPDGYTLGLGSTATMAVNRALYKKLPYDPLTDFEGVFRLASTPNVLVVSTTSPIRNTEDLIREMDRRKLTYSSPGNGTTQHLAGVLFTNLTGKTASHVPYRGPAEAVTALASAEIDYGFASLPSAMAQIRGGKLRVLGVTPITAPSSLPDAPTLASQGLAGFEKTDVWFGLVVPTGTPSEVIRVLEGASSKTLKNEEVRSKLAAAGYDPSTESSAAEFTSFLKEQIGFWGDLVRQSGASID